MFVPTSLYEYDDIGVVVWVPVVAAPKTLCTIGICTPIRTLVVFLSLAVTHNVYGRLLTFLSAAYRETTSCTLSGTSLEASCARATGEPASAAIRIIEPMHAIVLFTGCSFICGSPRHRAG